VNTHLHGAGDPGAAAARKARQTAASIRISKQQAKDSKTTQK
jgi:hypothetical protein